MTKYARIVIQDCENALQDLKKANKGQFRSRWVGAIALLRAVGHVLDKRDKKDDYLEEAIDKSWEKLKSSKPEPRIFWEFIDAERNNILKLYKFGTKGVTTVRPGTLAFEVDTGKQKIVTRPNKTTYDYFLADGPLEGYSPDEAIEESINWWKDYLDKVDQIASQLSSSHT